jgi:hypothetical protein
VSSFLAQARSRALRPMAGLPRPRLTVVSRAASRAPRVPFVVLVVTLLVGGLIGLLLLNTALQRGAYTTTGLRDQAAALEVRRQQLEVRVDAMAEPQRLAERAQSIGMVADTNPGYLNLSTGAIIGTPTAGRRSNRVDVAGIGSGSPRQSGKATLLAAGAANSLTSGPVVVPDPSRHDRHRDEGHDGTPAGSGTTGPDGVQYGGEDQGGHR